MNQKYGTSLRTNRPYYPSLIWGSLDKYKKRLKRLDSIEESYVRVEFEHVDIKKTILPEVLIMNNFLYMKLLNLRIK